MTAKNLLFSIILLLLGTTIHAQSSHSYLRKGDKAFKEQDFKKAEEDYRKSLEQKPSLKGTYNLGNSTYNQSRFDEAINHFTDAANQAKDNPTKSRAMHNLGNAHFQKQEFDKSIEAYKNALRLNPEDFGTKQNLTMAMKMLQQQQQQQQQQNQEGEGEENQDEQQQQQQEQEQKPQDGESEQENESKGEQQEQEEQPNPNQNQSQQELEEKDLSKEEARQLLKIMDQEEQKVQQKMRKTTGKPSKSAKDW